MLKDKMLRAWQSVTRKTKRRLAVSAILLALLALGFAYLPSVGLRYGITEGLRSLGMADVRLRTAELALFGGRIGLRRLDAAPAEGPTAGLASFDMVFAWRPLLSRRLQVERVAATGIDIEVIRKDDGSIVINGLPVPAPSPSAPTTPEAGEASTPWGLGIEELTISEGNLIFREGDVEVVFKLEKLRLTQLRSWEPGTPAKLELNATLNGSLFAVEGILLPFAANQSASLNLNVSALDLGRFVPLLKMPEIAKATGLLNAKTSLDARLGGADGFLVVLDGDLALEKVSADTSFGKAQAESLSLAGTSNLTGTGATFRSELRIKELAAEFDGNRISFDNLELVSTPLTTGLALDEKRLAWTGRLDLAGLDAEGQGAVVKLDRFAWNGRVEALALRELSGAMAGKLDLSGLELAYGDLALSGERLALTLTDAKGAMAVASAKVDGGIALSASGLTLDLPDLALQQGAFELTGQLRAERAAETTLAFDGRLAGSKSGLSFTDDRLELSSIVARMKPFTFTDRGPAGRQVDWRGDGEIAALVVAALGIDLKQERLAFAGESAISLDAEGRPTGRVSGRLESGNLELELAQLNLSLAQKRAEMRAEIELVAPAEGQLAPARIAGDLVLTGIAARDAKRQLDLLALEGLDLQGLRIAPDGALELERLRLADLKGLRRSGSANAAADYDWRLELSEVDLGQARRGASGDLTASSLVLTGLTARATRTEKGFSGLEAASDLPGAGEGTKADGPAAGRLALQRFELAGRNRILFVDRSTPSVLRVEAMPVQAKVGALDTAKPDSPTPVSLSIGMGKYGAISLQGGVRPFDPGLGLDLKAEVKGLDLPPFSPYMAQSLGVDFLTGSLNAEIKVAVQKEVIDGRAQVKLANVFLDERPGQESAIAKEAGLPVGSALGLLRDADDNIDLDIPLGGNIRDPQFDLSSTINKAIGAAIATAAATTLKVIFPPALLISAISASGQARPGIKPLDFAAAADDVTEPHREQLKLVAELMRQRPTLNMNLCGVATRSDWEAIAAERAREEAERKKAEAEAARQAAAKAGQKPPEAEAKPPEEPKPAPAPEPDRAILEDLARLRSAAAKHVLVADLSISADRVFECRPILQLSPEARPRVDLRF